MIRLANINGRQINKDQCAKRSAVEIGCGVCSSLGLGGGGGHVVVSCRVGPNERRFKKSTCEKYLGRETEIY